MELMTSKQVAEYMSLPSEGAVKKMMKRFQIKPFDLGIGRGLGYRWDREEIDRALRLLRDGVPAEEKTKNPKPRKRKGLFNKPYRAC